MPAIELSAGTIDYLDTGGDGPVVVPVHGVMMDATVWGQVVADLRADHRCIVPTLPLGAHRHPMRPGADLSMGGQAELLGELIERLDLDEATLVVNDWGGPLVTAVRHPDLVARLVVTPCEAFDNMPPGLPGRFAELAGRMPGGIFMAVQALRIPALRRLPTTFGPMAAAPDPRRPRRGVDRGRPPPAGRAPRPRDLHPHDRPRRVGGHRRRPGGARHPGPRRLDHRRPGHAGRARAPPGGAVAARPLRGDPRRSRPRPARPARYRRRHDPAVHRRPPARGGRGSTPAVAGRVEHRP